jgi:hypothetical protein
MAYYTPKAIWYSQLLLGYKPVQRVTVLNTVSKSNTLASTEWDTKKKPAFRFARILVIFSLALVCIFRRVFEQLNSRAEYSITYIINLW